MAQLRIAAKCKSHPRDEYQYFLLVLFVEGAVFDCAAKSALQMADVHVLRALPSTPSQDCSPAVTCLQDKSVANGLPSDDRADIL